MLAALKLLSGNVSNLVQYNFHSLAPLLREGYINALVCVYMCMFVCVCMYVL